MAEQHKTAQEPAVRFRVLPYRQALAGGVWFNQGDEGTVAASEFDPDTMERIDEATQAVEADPDPVPARQRRKPVEEPAPEQAPAPVPEQTTVPDQTQESVSESPQKVGE